jgi:Tfp pilus assembly protein PilO
MRGRPDRAWLVGGAVAAVALLAGAWFLLISPAYAEAASLRQQTVADQDGLPGLVRQLRELERQHADLPSYRQELERGLLALPADPDLSAFLREVQAAGDATGVSVSGVTVGMPAAVSGDNKATSLQVSVSVDGTAAKLNAFLDQLQVTQPRAVLVTSVGLASPPKATTVTMTMTMQVFVAQITGK